MRDVPGLRCASWLVNALLTSAFESARQRACTAASSIAVAAPCAIVRRYRMTCVAEEDDRAVAPLRERLPFEDRSFVAIGTRIEHGAHVRMKSFARFLRLVGVALGRPRLACEPFGRLGRAGDEIDFAASMFAVARRTTSDAWMITARSERRFQ